MFSLSISVSAKADLKRIYAYGLVEFGEKQADMYFTNLYRMFEKICANPLIYQSIDHIRPGYRRCTCGADSIYYRLTDSTVQIMAILGGQDTENWL